MQEDVYQGDGLNLYAYCRNNPVVYYDPSGYSNTKMKASGCAGDGKFGEDNKEVNDLIKKIPSKYKNYGQCDKFASSLKNKLDKAGIDYDIYLISSDYPLIISKSNNNESIGSYHYGIKVGNKIYDNFYVKGIDFASWKDNCYVDEREVRCSKVDKIKK